MKKELSNKIIFNDFINKTILNELEVDILTRYIKNESIIEISQKINQSTSTVSRIIAQLKIKYDNYKKIEIAKLLILE
jgi:predicted transcriptional regulator